MKTLYGLTKEGKVKIVNVYSDGTHMVVESGRYGGKLVTHDKVCKEKNTGRANFVSAEEQAKLEVSREIKKKIEQDFYVEIPAAIEGNLALIEEFLGENIDKSSSPMLAETYEDFKHKVDYSQGILESEKLDGNRCTLTAFNGVISLKSRKGKAITTMGHIEKQAMQIHMNSKLNFILDGELYNHNTDDDQFEMLQSAVKKYHAGVSELVELHVYDMIFDKPVAAVSRYNYYKEFLTKFGTSHIFAHKQYVVHSEQEMMDLFRSFTSNGFEGAVLRMPGAFYENNRTQSMLKVKEMQDDEFKILDVIPMESRPEFARVVLCTADGKPFKATPKCSEPHKIEMLKNREQYLGKVGTVQFFSKTKNNIPRFPVFKGLRELSDLN
jgi:ATP-dependent DNA ligase